MMSRQLSAEEWLQRENTVLFNDRVERLNWLQKRYPEIDFQGFPGGLHSKYLFEETRYCFVYAQYFAVIVLGLAFIERSLAAIFYSWGRNDLERATITTLLKTGLEEDMLTREEFDKLIAIKDKRNVVAHFRPPGHVDSVEIKALERNEQPYNIIEDDAKEVLLMK